MTICRRVRWIWLCVAMGAVVAPRLVHGADPSEPLDLGGGLRMEMVRIPAGAFTQGSPPDEPRRGDDESRREVRISSDFYLGKAPVTRGQFARFVAETGFRTESEKGTSGGFGFENGKLVQKREYTWRNPGFPQTDDHPVVLVTYDDALAFLKWLSAKTRRECRLPSEAEWEYACRAGTTTAFYSGATDEDAAAIAWYNTNAGNGTRPVDEKQPNAFGLVDMAGNVAEWCRDWYGPYPAGPVIDPVETRGNLSNPARRVLRGGSWLKDVRNCRSAARFRSTPGSRNADFGFRVSYRLTSLATPVEAPTPPVRPTPPTAPTPPRTPTAPTAPTPPVAPAPHTAPMPPARPQAPRFSVTGLLCPAVLVLGGLALLAYFAVRALARHETLADEAGAFDDEVQPLTASQRRKGPAPRIVSDGFWLDDPMIEPGSIVRYSCFVNQSPISGEFTVGEGAQGQFVYTGGTPEDVEILEVRPGAGFSPDDDFGGAFGTGTRIGASRMSSTPPRPPRDTPSRPRGFPPAY